MAAETRKADTVVVITGRNKLAPEVL